MTNKIIISPSLLACNFLNIQSELTALENIPNIWLHLDIMDGHFVPNLTFGAPIVKMISQRTKLPLDAHLMVTNPKFHIDLMKDYGVHNITFHAELFPNSNDLLEHILYAKKFYKSVGISLRPNTPISSIDISVWSVINLLLIMSVEPGFGGQSFIENTWNKLSEVANLKKDLSNDFIVQVDGGVTNKNSAQLVSAGVSNLVAGSYVFKDGKDTYNNKIESLR